jgi:hypothetical protein
MMNCVSAARASTYVHKHSQLHPLKLNAFSPQLQTRALILAACNPSFFAPAECPLSTRSGKATGDPPQKRSPALVGSKRRADRNNEKSQREKNYTKAGQDSQAIERRLFWVTHGQTNVGFVEQIGKSYKAIAADERILGAFGSLKEAANAVSAACEAAP